MKKTLIIIAIGLLVWYFLFRKKTTTTNTTTTTGENKSGSDIVNDLFEDWFGEGSESGSGSGSGEDLILDNGDGEFIKDFAKPPVYPTSDPTLASSQIKVNPFAAEMAMMSK
jgi:hypothetical protein